MGINTGIAWTDSSFNPWWGCTEVSPGCDNCYAKALAQRFGVEWGNGKPRRFFGDRHWNEPLRWNKKARESGKRWLVFAGSMCDWADNEVPQEHRERLFELIKQTENLTWMLLTKRIGNVEKMLPSDWGDGYDNVAIGSSVVTQPEADRDLRKLRDVPAKRRFVSIEPQIEKISIMPDNAWLDLVIVGGESRQKGGSARPFFLEWALTLIDECKSVDVPIFVKQLGACPVSTMDGPNSRIELSDERAGANPDEWPLELRVQEHFK